MTITKAHHTEGKDRTISIRDEVLQEMIGEVEETNIMTTTGEVAATGIAIDTEIGVENMTRKPIQKAAKQIKEPVYISQ